MISSLQLRLGSYSTKGIEKGRGEWKAKERKIGLPDNYFNFVHYNSWWRKLLPNLIYFTDPT